MGSLAVFPSGLPPCETILTRSAFWESGNFGQLFPGPFTRLSLQELLLPPWLFDLFNASTATLDSFRHINWVKRRQQTCPMQVCVESRLQWQQLAVVWFLKGMCDAIPLFLDDLNLLRVPHLAKWELQPSVPAWLLSVAPSLFRAVCFAGSFALAMPKELAGDVQRTRGLQLTWGTSAFSRGTERAPLTAAPGPEVVSLCQSRVERLKDGEGEGRDIRSGPRE